MPTQETLYKKDGKRYVFEDDQLIQFQGVKAEGLSTYDDLELIQNQLWGTTGPDGKDPLTMKPLHSLSVGHIRAILRDTRGGKFKVKRPYIEYFENKLMTMRYDGVKMSSAERLREQGTKKIPNEDKQHIRSGKDNKSEWE